MKEIGSIFPIYPERVPGPAREDSGAGTGELRFALCREALLYAARSLDQTRRVVMLPAYTCQTVIDPFLQDGWKCCFYGVTEDLRTDPESFLSVLNVEHPSAVVIHPYFGQAVSAGEAELLSTARADGAAVIEDITQCIFRERNEAFADFYVGSYRKWFSVPDGAFLSSASRPLGTGTGELSEYGPYVDRQTKAMVLRGRYFLGGDGVARAESRRLYDEATDLADHGGIGLHRMSQYSERRMAGEDLEGNRNARMRNAAYLFENLDRTRCACPIASMSSIASAPLYFPIYAEDRPQMQKRLYSAGIYAPVIWHALSDTVLISDTVRKIYRQILAIPIDQRYDLGDMERICSVIRS